jgi:hypothetical protein
LQLQLCVVISCVKLRRFADALQAIEQIGDLDAPAMLYQSHPTHYDIKGMMHSAVRSHLSQIACQPCGVLAIGSMVPFSLRLLHAELPSLSGNSAASLDLLFALLARCKNQVYECEANATPATPKASAPVVVDLSELAVSLPNASVSCVWR